MLDEKLLQERLNQFKPEPLVDYKHDETKTPETEIVNDTETEDIDLVKANYLNVLTNKDMLKTSEEYIRKYGVGTCGPRAFYGTTDVHLNLEESLAKFLGMENSIVYSYGFVAISSAIAAYCKKKDVVFVDREANFPIEQGLIAAKSKIVYFDHHDPNSLYEEAKKIAAKETKKPSRKFLIIEGVSWKTGKVCPLPDFIRVAEEFKMRVFLEETYTLGIFGANGRGLLEHYDLPVEKIDMVFGTLEGAIGSIGGFCAGPTNVIEHQRLSGAGYIFSASLPTYLAQVALKSIETLNDKPKRFVEFSQAFHRFLTDICRFEVVSDPMCPFKIITTRNKTDRVKCEAKIHDHCKRNGVHFMRAEKGLMINLNLALTDQEKRLGKVFEVIKEAADIYNH